MAKNDLVSREDIWELAGSMAMTVRPGSELECVIRRYANAIDNAPTIDAIPVEWLRKVRNDDKLTLDDVETIDLLLAWWQKEQEAQE